MALNVKNKIRLGTLFLFLLLILTGGASIYFMSKLKTEANNILTDNYESISYGHTMQQQLNSFETSYAQSVKEFETFAASITEPMIINRWDALRQLGTIENRLK